MDLRFIRALIDQLDGQGVLFDRGLADEEVQAVEGEYGFRFPPDLRKLLQRALPISERFPNWRKGPATSLRRALRAPADGILFEVARSSFWSPAWGSRPAAVEDALAQVRSRLRTAPQLIPVYGHHYLPADPPQSGNPVFSVVQADIIYEACDLASYFATTFGVPCPSWAATTPRAVSFWDDLVS